MGVGDDAVRKGGREGGREGGLDREDDDRIY